MLNQEKRQILELIDMVLDSILVIQERTSHIQNGDDFMLSPDKYVYFRWSMHETYFYR